MARLAEINIESPGQALSTRAAWDYSVMEALIPTTRRFLSETIEEVSRHGLNASSIRENYRRQVVDETLARLSSPYPEALEEIELGLNDDFPSEVYETARVVLATASQQRWSEQDTRAQLIEALDLDSPSVGQEALLAAGFAQGLRARGVSWLAKTRGKARTVSTRAHGYVSLLQIRTTRGYTHKRWITRRDDRVRETHALADGQIVPLSAGFQVGLATLKYPADGAGPLGEVIECRCVVVGAKRGTS